MNFEPTVLQSIKQHNREITKKNVLLLLPFFIALLVAILILTVTAARVKPFSSAPIPPLYEVGTYLQESAVLIKVLAMLTLPFMLYLAYVCYARARYSRERFTQFISEQALEFNRTGFLKFTEAVDGLSIAAGVTRPKVIILDDPAANAMAFIDTEGNPVIGVTGGLLTADISVDESNGIMAHELSHLIINEGMEPPSLWNIEFMPTLLLVAYGTFAAVSISLLRPDLRYVMVGLGIAVVIFAALVAFQRSNRFIMKQLDLAHHHDDILADSIAVTLTRDPDALAGAIKKIENLMKEAPRPPGGTILTRYLFVTPPATAGDYYRYATQIVSTVLSMEKQPRTWVLAEKPSNTATRELLELESTGTKERLQNLNLIKQGTWRALEDWSAGD